MANLFDSDNYPQTEPSSFIEGDRVAWKRADLHSDYDNTLYTLSYEARLEGDGTASISISATASGTDYLVELPSATTLAYSVGVYHWSAYITRDADSQRVQVDSGTFEVKADKATATTDPRTYWRVVRDNVRAVMTDTATTDQRKFEMNGTSLERRSVSELLALLNRAEYEVYREEQKERVNNGKTGRNILVRHQYGR